MARQRRGLKDIQPVPNREAFNPFTEGPTQRANREARLQNELNYENDRRVGVRDQMMQDLPDGVRKNAFAQSMGDAVVDARNLPYGQAAVLTGGALATGGLLNAYAQQQQEGLPTGPIGTLSRGAFNAVDAVAGMGGYGGDPFAEARNNLATAGQELGSARVIEALAMDQIEEMEVIDNELKTLHPEVQARIQTEADRLMQLPVQAADGTVRPYSPEKAYTDAIKIVEAQIRAGG